MEDINLIPTIFSNLARIIWNHYLQLRGNTYSWTKTKRSRWSGKSVQYWNREWIRSRKI